MSRKILFHHNCLEQGGAERVISNLANQLVKDGDEVIIATEWQGEVEFQIDPRIRRIHVGLSGTQSQKSRLAKIYYRFANLRKLLKQEKPDVAIGFTRKPLYRLLISAKGLKTPVIIAVRTNPKGHYDKKMDKVIGPILWPRANGAVFQTTGQRDFFPKYLRDKSTIILNPVNDKYFNAPHVDKKEKIIVHSGRIIDFKNQSMLIKAFLRVHEQYPEYSLHLYGPDSHDGTKEILENIIKENNAEEFVKLMGGSDSLEIEIPKCEIYAFSSDWEGLPNALLEAMALGMPIVATDCPCGGPATVMKDGENGLLVPIMDEEAYAKALCRLIENPQLAQKLGDNAKKIADIVNGPAIVDQWKKYIEKVIEKDV